MFDRASAAYCDLIARTASERDQVVEGVCLGQTWTAARSLGSFGFAMSPAETCRTLPWPGTLAGRSAGSLAPWVSSWDPFEAAVGLAAANMAINAPGNALLEQAQPLGAGNLAVFEHFRPRLEGKTIAVIGRYPGLDRIMDGLSVSVIERLPGPGDLPDTAAETVLPECDWVFITATSLLNKTFPRLAELSRRAVSVLMGPSTPWLQDWRDYGIDYVAGVRVIDRERAWRITLEGGGTRLFNGGVQYALAELRR